jgi:glucose-1-phosphate adenylyltransferase
MDYDVLTTFHTQKEADATICSLRVPLEEGPRFGILATDQADRVTSFVEKPKEPPGTLASMGIYVFNLRVLDRLLLEDSRRGDSGHDFGRDIIPRMIAEGYRVFAYPYNGYWVDVGTLDSYWQAHMDLLQHPPPLDLNNRNWIIHTKSEERPPVLIQQGALVKDSMITDGCVIAPGARVERCVLSPGVYVGPEAVVRESIILTDTYIEAGARVERAIIDKVVTIGHNAHVGEINHKAAGLGITTVGKNTSIPNGQRVGRGAMLGPDLLPEHLPLGAVRAGKVVERPRTA